MWNYASITINMNLSSKNREIKGEKMIQILCFLKQYGGPDVKLVQTFM